VEHVIWYDWGLGQFFQVSDAFTFDPARGLDDIRPLLVQIRHTSQLSVKTKIFVEDTDISLDIFEYFGKIYTSYNHVLSAILKTPHPQATAGSTSTVQRWRTATIPIPGSELTRRPPFMLWCFLLLSFRLPRCLSRSFLPRRLLSQHQLLLHRQLSPRRLLPLSSHPLRSLW
jgi:hypothetical protein